MAGSWSTRVLRKVRPGRGADGGPVRAPGRWAAPDGEGRVSSTVTLFVFLTVLFVLLAVAVVLQMRGHAEWVVLLVMAVVPLLGTFLTVIRSKYELEQLLSASVGALAVAVVVGAVLASLLGSGTQDVTGRTTLGGGQQVIMESGDTVPVTVDARPQHRTLRLRLTAVDKGAGQTSCLPVSDLEFTGGGLGAARTVEVQDGDRVTEVALPVDTGASKVSFGARLAVLSQSGECRVALSLRQAVIE